MSHKDDHYEIRIPLTSVPKTAPKETRIVKVQLPLVTSPGIPNEALIYNWNRSIDVYVAAETVKGIMNDQPKAYFYYRINDEGGLEIGEPAPWQEW